MAWLVLLALAVIIVAVGLMVFAAMRGMGEAKPDGWSPAESLIGRKIRSRPKPPDHL